MDIIFHEFVHILYVQLRIFLPFISSCHEESKGPVGEPLKKEGEGKKKEGKKTREKERERENFEYIFSLPFVRLGRTKKRLE